MNKVVVALVIGGFTLRSIAMEQPQVAKKSTQYPFALLENLINNSKSGAEIVDLYEAASEKDRDMLIRRVSCFALGACSSLAWALARTTDDKAEKDTEILSESDHTYLLDAERDIDLMRISIKRKYAYIFSGKEIPIEFGCVSEPNDAYEVLIKIFPLYQLGENGEITEKSLVLQTKSLLMMRIPKVLQILNTLEWK